VAKNHYVPQFYLRNFSPTKGGDDIIVYKRNEKPFRSNIINIASSNDFYSVKDEKTGKKDTTIEKFFSQLEGAAKPIIEKLICEKNADMTEDNRIVLTHFMGFLFVRNQVFRQKTKNFYSEIMKQTIAFGAHNKEYFHEMLKKATGKNLTKSQMERTREFALKGEYDIGYENDDHFIGATLSLAKDIMPIFWGKHWKIITTKTSRSFVTSDNPMSLARPRDYIKSPFGGLGLLEADIFLPLSPDTVLLCTNNKEWPNIIEIKREWVDSTNRLTAQFAQKFLLADIESQDISMVFNNTNEGDSTKVYTDNSFFAK